MKKRAKILAMFFTALVIGQTNSSANSMMYWTDFGAKKIQRANLDGSGIRDLITTGLGKLGYIALDTAAGKMYWTDSAFDMIQRANLNGSHIEALVTTGLSSPGGIALDVDAGKMYWTDSLTHKIQRANLNGSGVEDLVTTGLQWPQGIALDVTGGKMYWTDGGTAKIQRANLDGSGVEDLVTAGSGALQGIALDVSAGKMYWADLIQIQRANLDGSNVELLVTTGGRLRGIALDVSAGKMYWTDTLWFGKIQCANLDGSEVQDLIVGGMNFPLGLALDVPKPPKIIYVDADASGANNGSSWADAYNDLQDALATAQYGDEIRVAHGIYKPAPPPGPKPPPIPWPPWPPPPPPPQPIPPIDQTATFQLINGVTIKGGYAGFGEPDPNSRDIDAYETILSGDIKGNDSEVNEPADLLDDPCRADNSYNVVTASGTDATAILDGFTITAGNANILKSYSQNKGGGIYNYDGSPTIINCTFIENSAIQCGGGMYNHKYGHPTLTNCTFIFNVASSGGGIYGGYGQNISCTFTENSAHNNGGGLANYGGLFKNCTIIGNLTDNNGGGIYYDHARPTKIINCLISANLAGNDGGGIYWPSPLTAPPPGPGEPQPPEPSIVLTNCTINGNSANRYGGGIFSVGKSVITNCILWDDIPEEIYVYHRTPVITYSNVQSGWIGEGNIDADPFFVEPGYWDASGVWIDGDYHLLPDSPCINAGDPNYVAGPNETDLDGNPRVIGGRIDMGAYEFQNTPPVADAGPEKVVECVCNTNEGTKVTLDGTGSYDADGDSLTYTWTGPFVESPAHGAAPIITLDGGCPGEYVITLVVNDGTEDSAPNDVVITVVDTTPPEFALSVNPTMLWPPNNKMVKITPSWTVSDNCDAMPGVSLVSISINESNAKGNGRTDNDVKIGDDGSIYLRAERSGKGGDRIYTITYRAVDDSGNTTISSATVTVPHDRR